MQFRYRDPGDQPNPSLRGRFLAACREASSAERKRMVSPPKSSAARHRRLLATVAPQLLTLVLVFAIFIFGTLRDQNEFRWSGWAFSDVQTLNAALRFVRDGIFSNLMLPNLAGNTEIGATYPPYTQYPQFIEIPLITGLMHLGITDVRLLKTFHVALSALFLLLLFRFFSRRLPGWAALFGLVYISGSVVFLDFVNSFVQGYDEIFRAWFFLAIFGYADELCRPDKNSRKAAIFLSGAFFSALLQSLNSYEYIFALQTFGLGYLGWRRALTLKNALILLSAPAIGLTIHFAQVILYEGLHGFFTDFRARLLFRTYDNFTLGPWQILRGLSDGLVLGYGVNLLSFALLGILFLVALAFGIEDRGQRKELWLIGALLLLSDVSWYACFPQSTLNFIVYMMKHLFPVLGFVVGATIFFLFRSLLMALRLRRWATATVSVAGILTLSVVIILPTEAHLRDYLKQYPNIVGDRTYQLGVPTRDWMSDIRFMQRLRSLRIKGHDAVLIETQKLHSYTSPSGPYRNASALYTYYCECYIVSIVNSGVLTAALLDLNKHIKRPTDIFFASSPDDDEFNKLHIAREYSEFGANWRVVKIDIPVRDEAR